MRGTSIFLPLILGLLALAPRSARAADAPLDPHKAVVIRLSGEVDDYVRNTIYRDFSLARAQGAGTVILELDTYGGLVTAGLDISVFLKRQNDMHVIAFVHDKAISAGAMIALACNEIVVDPSAQIGDCAPIIYGPDGQLQGLPATERAKMQTPIVADFRDSAARNGYDIHLVDAMVQVDHPVYCLIDAQGHRHFANAEEKTLLLAQGMKIAADVPDPVNGPESLLTVHADEAVKLGLARGKAADADDLAKQRGLQITDTLAPGWGETLVQFLGSAIVRGLLITVFILALQVALSAPGHGAAEAVAIVSLGIVLGVPLLTGYALWWEVLLILCGLGLVAFEIFVFPGHFVSLVAGSMMVLFGLVLTFAGHDPGAPPWMPETRAGWIALRDGLTFVAGSMCASALLGAWLSRYLPAVPFFKRLILATTSASNRAPAPASVTAASATVPSDAVGLRGIATTDLRPGGLGEFIDPDLGGRRVVSVIAESGFIPAGSPLLVLESRGSYVIVRSLAPASVPT